MLKQIIKKLVHKVLLTDKLKASNWWKNQYFFTNDFKPQPYFRTDYKRNYNYMVLGSDTSAVDIEFHHKEGLNLSSGTQPLSVDEKILYFYHSYLRKGATVILGIDPCSSQISEQKLFVRFMKPLPISEKEKYGDYYTPIAQLLPNIMGGG